ncbi:hypothetical protein E2562_013264 [Oryza meyeriana var. granulata]|uniref:Uncharacterized protein n=1 Tax=Oryza meyeriana var. granulata TaxID=110450 RepID=A0A6G1D3F7_9ORYZ|nr:hypothetical protein E2562_013264 [Oryza meyeriana var. granulata]
MHEATRRLEMAAEPVHEPPQLVLRFRNGEPFFADTNNAQEVPCGYPIDAPFIRCERTFGLLDEYTRTHAQHGRGGPVAVPDIAAWDRDFMERHVTDADTLHDLFVTVEDPRFL